MKLPILRFETARLIVRPHRVEDAARYLAWDTDAELVYLNDDESDRYQAFTIEEAELYMRSTARQNPQRGIVHFAIQKKEDDALIGFCIVAEIEPNHRRCKIGITIGERSEWGKGYAREALIPVIDYCFTGLGLNRIMAEIYCMNTRSCRLFERLGFKHEGTLRQSVWKQGQPLDDCLYGLLRKDWEERRGKTGP